MTVEAAQSPRSATGRPRSPTSPSWRPGAVIRRSIGPARGCRRRCRRGGGRGRAERAVGRRVLCRPSPSAARKPRTPRRSGCWATRPTAAASLPTSRSRQVGDSSPCDGQLIHLPMADDSAMGIPALRATANEPEFAAAPVSGQRRTASARPIRTDDRETHPRATGAGAPLTLGAVCSRAVRTARATMRRKASTGPHRSPGGRRGSPSGVVRSRRRARGG